MRYTEDGRRWLLVAEAVYQSGRSESTIRGRVKAGTMEAKVLGRQLYVSQSSVDQLWLEEQGPWRPILTPAIREK